MSNMTTDEWRARVGTHVETRRRAIYRSRRAAATNSGVSEVVWRQIESGRRQVAPGVILAPNPEAGTRAGICRRLRWTDDSIDRLIEGQQPVEVEGPSEEPAPALEARVSSLEGRLSRIEDLLTGRDAP